MAVAHKTILLCIVVALLAGLIQAEGPVVKFFGQGDWPARTGGLPEHPLQFFGASNSVWNGQYTRFEVDTPSSSSLNRNYISVTTFVSQTGYVLTISANTTYAFPQPAQVIFEITPNICNPPTATTTTFSLAHFVCKLGSNTMTLDAITIDAI